MSTNMKNFTTAAKEVSTDEDVVDEVIEFGIDGHVVTGTVPTPEQIALYASSFSVDATMPDQVAGTLGFMREVLEPASFAHVNKRLRDKRDPFSFESLQAIIEYLLEQVTAFPTQPSSGSTSRRAPAGAKSMDHLPPKAQTRSRSPRAGSATSSTRG
jgi:hypothetical protein